MSLLELHAISRTYSGGSVLVRALRSIDLSVESGEWVTVVGPSGSGKSTLLNILGLLDRADEGDYHLAGEDVGTAGDRRRSEMRNRLVGFVFQSFKLLPRTAAVENVATPLLYRGTPGRLRRERALAALARVGLSERSDHDPSELSGGQMQRVAIARALVGDPAIILADEPTGNLDSASGADILDLFASLHEEGRTLVVITHEPEVAGRSDRRLVLTDGRLEEA